MNDRVAKLANVLSEAGVDAFFANTPATMGYLHGVHESGGERFLTLAISKAGEVRLIAPALAETQARRAGVKDVRPWKDGEDPIAHLHQLADDWNLESAILAVDDEMSARMLLQLQSALPAALFKTGGFAVSSLMRRKEPEELDWMRQAAKIADDAFVEVLPTIKVGDTEIEIAERLSDSMKKRGGKPVFSIVAAGPNGAEPHHLSDETRLKAGDVLIMDFGCDVEGYKSDITRTACIGRATENAKRVYSLVHEAHQAARRAIVPGATGEVVDRAARSVIEAGGFGSEFFHRTGHGIGSQIHEEPNIVVGNTIPLEPGNCFSIEPGIYLAGQFGVRIENIVAATLDGHESLNGEPAPALIELA